MIHIFILISFIFAFFSIISIAVYSTRNRSRVNNQNQLWPVAAKPIMTGIEFRLYYLLINTLPECKILCQVGIMSLLQMGGDRKSTARYWNKISAMTLDFVVIDSNGTVVAVIELDDKTHDLSSRKSADLNKYMALKSAGYKLLRWKTHQEPTAREIRIIFCEDRNHSNKSVFDKYGPLNQ